VLAVILGYVVFAASAVLWFNLAGRDPHTAQSLGFTVFSVIYGIAFAALGGLLAASIAPSRRILHAAIVASIIALGAIVSLLARSGVGSTWSQWSALVFMAPSAWAAPKVFARRVHE
jgi:hypothetical protein